MFRFTNLDIFLESNDIRFIHTIMGNRDYHELVISKFSVGHGRSETYRHLNGALSIWTVKR